MGRTSLIAAIVLCQITVTTDAGGALAESLPLAPGKPAGVEQAQATVPNSMLFVGLGVAVVGLGLYLASGTYKIPGQSKTGTSATGTSP